MPIRLTHLPTTGSIDVWATFNSLPVCQTSSVFSLMTQRALPTWRRFVGAMGSYVPHVNLPQTLPAFRHAHMSSAVANAERRHDSRLGPSCRTVIHPC